MKLPPDIRLKRLCGTSGHVARPPFPGGPVDGDTKCRDDISYRAIGRSDGA
jgi:hypothetical protein